MTALGGQGSMQGNLARVYSSAFDDHQLKARHDDAARPVTNTARGRERHASNRSPCRELSDSCRQVLGSRYRTAVVNVADQALDNG